MEGLWELVGKCKFRLGPSKAQEILVWLSGPFGIILSFQVLWHSLYECVLAFHSLLIYEFLEPLCHLLLTKWLGRSCLRLTWRDAHRLVLQASLHLLSFVILVLTSFLHIGRLLVTRGALRRLNFECGALREFKLFW